MKSLFTAATGMDAQQTRISVIANNLANMSTTGFKASRAVFQDLLYQTMSEPGAESASGVTAPSGIQVGSGAKVLATPSQFSQGILENTGRELDVAIEGNGFFEVTLPNGTFYTRSGSLAVNQTGELVTQQGFSLSPAITGLSDATAISIAQDGTISATINGTQTTLGPIQIATFPNSAGLKSVGRNLFQSTEASGTATLGQPGTNSAGTLRQGFLEGSNVNIAEELINMVMAQRAFELNSKVIRSSDEMMQAMNQMR